METETTQNRAAALNIPAFWKAQQKDWRITVIRTSLERLGYKIILPYLTLYIVLLGATKTQLGLVTSLGLIASGLIGPYIGQVIDRHGPKKVYIVGILILAGGYLAFASAPVWQVAALGMFLHQLGGGVGGQSCATICGNCLANCDRAKGMLVCESLAAGVLGMVGPMISGWFLVNIMGVKDTPTDPNTIRPLFLITLIITIISLLVVVFKLSFSRWTTSNSAVKRNVFKDAVAILKADKNCVKWIFMAIVGNMPVAMVVPYVQIFVAETKNASVTTLSGMVTATALTSVVCGYFFGILGDRFGRKKILSFTIGLYLVGLVLLVTTKSPFMLLTVGILQGFQEIGGPLAASIQNELVPHKVMGRWVGVVRFFSSMFSALMAALAGIIYDQLGGQWIFILYIACEICIRLPLLFSLPETLHHKVDEEAFASLDD